ncbi:MAG: type II secretion system protein GspK, partial [Pseudomonadota bacterium]|nr:type II secretion system protein GspK [Pseudomonadota bacterium]
NRRFGSVQELQQVRGFEQLAAFQAIEPYVSALPSFAPINLNTASVPVLTALHENIERTQVEQWATTRDQNQQPIDQVGEFWTQASLDAVTAEQRSALQRFLSVKSRYYQAQVTVQLSGRSRYLTSDLYRKGAVVQAYQRSLAIIAPMPVAEPE